MDTSVPDQAGRMVVLLSDRRPTRMEGIPTAAGEASRPITKDPSTFEGRSV